MATNYADKVIYQVFPRNHTPEGTLEGVERDLDRIVSLGVDILYLMPVQPIGRVGRKGSLGSPYAISDYEAINPEYGTWDDFDRLVKKAHERGLRVMCDQVFNHTARDSVLIERHPDFYYHDKDGNLGNKAGAWSDVYDLDHSNPELTAYLISVLDRFVDHGVDGFRFDVASLIPDSFFQAYREHLATRYPGREITLLAECIDTPFILYTRAEGFNACSNSQLSDAGFQLFYDYGSFDWFRTYMRTFSERDLAGYRAAITLEEANLPQDRAWVVRTLENHDQPRIASYTDSEHLHRNLLAYSFFTCGPAFIYAGEEVGCTHEPSLFDKDTVDFDQPHAAEVTAFIRKLTSLKRREKNRHLLTTLFPDSEGLTLVCVNRYDDGSEETGVFNLSTEPQNIPVEGEFTDLLTGSDMIVAPGERGTFTEPLYLVRK